MLEEFVFTVEEVAAILKCGPETIRRAIRGKKLRAAKLGKAWTISKPDLAAFYNAASGGGALF